MSAAALGLLAVGWTLALAGAALLVRSRVRDAARAELVAQAVHELRGPLFAAGLALHGLGRRGLPVGPARAELDRAERALGDLEEAPRGVWSRVAPVGVPVDVGALLARHADAWAAAAAAHGGRLVVAPRPARAAVCTGDPVRLAAAVWNLVANAAEHGTGRIDLGVRTYAGRVLVEVRDEGPGVPQPVAAILARRPRAGRRGRGRGLAVVVQIAAAHGGTLVAARGPAGPRMVLELPARGARPELDDAAQPSTDGAALSVRRHHPRSIVPAGTIR